MRGLWGLWGLWPVCAAIVAAPSFRFFPLSTYDEQRLVSFVACVAAVFLTAASSPARSAAAAIVGRVPSAARAVAAGALGLGFVSALTATHVRASMVDVFHTALLAAAVVSVAAAFAACGARARILAAGAVLASVALVVADLGLRIVALNASGAESALVRDVFSRFHHVRYFGHWATWTLPLVSMAAFVPPRRLAVRLSAGALASALWALALVSGGRGTLAAQVVASIAVLAVLGRAALPWLRLHAGTAAAGAALYLLGAFVLPGARAALAPAAAHLGSFSDSGRGRIWGEAIEMIRADPLLGEGPRAFSYHSHLPAAHPHDAPLQWAAEWGLPASLLMTALLAMALGCWLARLRAAAALASDPAEASVRAALTAALIAAAVHALICGVVVTPLSQLVGVLVLGWAGGSYAGVHTQRTDRIALADSLAPSRAWTLASYAIALACMLAMSPEIARAWSWRMPSDAADVHLRPRYWTDETAILRVNGVARPARRPLRSP